MTKSYTETLAEFAAATSFDELPEEEVHATKRLILDTIGCSVGAHSTDAGKIIAQIIRELGGKPESTILVTGDRTSCTNAAYVNAWLANIMDADDTTLCYGGGHFAQCEVLPALAVAERVVASGKQLIEAVALGYEVAGRVGSSLRLTMADDGTGKLALVPTAGQSWAVFGAAVAAGKLLGLDAVRMAHAMGIAGYTVSVPTIGKFLTFFGKWRQGASPAGGIPMTKYTVYGAIAEPGVKAALLAEKGFTGDRTVLDGDRGFWRMEAAARCDWDLLTTQLGQRWFVGLTSLKPYPACRHTNAPIDLFYKIMRENQLEVDQVDVSGLSILKEHFSYTTVLTQVDTQFSIPYELAMAALGIAPGPEWENPARFQDPKVLAFARKVKFHADPAAEAAVFKEQAKGQWKKEPARVEVKAKGKTFSAQSDYAKGDPWELVP